MVEHEHEQVIVLGDLHERGSEERAGAQVERPARLLLSPFARIPLRIRGREIDGLHMKRDVGRDQPLLVSGRTDAAAEDVVPRDHAGEARFERRHVERAAQAERHWHVIGGASRLELIEEPQPLLLVRERRVAAIGRARDRFPFLVP